MRDRTRDGFSNRAEAYFLYHFPRFWRCIMAIPPLRRLANKLIISRAAQRALSRPLPFSSMPIKGDSSNPMACYTSWESLTDRDWFDRHLPPKDLPSYPELSRMASLFKVRPEGPILSEDSTVLFLSFAQTFFAFGSQRANVTPFTAGINTLFLREHNRLAGMLEDANPSWDDERVFQTARNINIVLLIKVVVEEYINHISPYHFQFSADPSVCWRAVWNKPNWIPIEFNLLYRWHSLTPDRFFIGDRKVPAEDILYDNGYLSEGGLTAIIASASRQRSWQLGLFNTAKFLIPIELAAIQQSRDNRIGSYNDYREAFGFPRVTRFEQITEDQCKIDALLDLYLDVDNIEYTVGLLAEDVGPHAAVPPLIGRMVALDAFSEALTNPLLSEHVFNERTFTEEGMRTIAATHQLQDIFNRNNAPGQQPISFSMTYQG